MKFHALFLLLCCGALSYKIGVINFPKYNNMTERRIVEAVVPKVMVDKLALCVQFKVFFRYHKVILYSSYLDRFSRFS